MPVILRVRYWVNIVIIHINFLFPLEKGQLQFTFYVFTVVDSGFVKLRWFNTSSLTDSLVVVPVSKASADQRSGRAGRVRSGKAYRLYSEKEYLGLSVATPPEMQRSELSAAVLQLKALGIDNVLRFSFPSPPPAASLLAALELLYALGALDKAGQLTKPLGVTMAELPSSALYSKCLVVSGTVYPTYLYYFNDTDLLLFIH